MSVNSSTNSNGFDRNGMYASSLTSATPANQGNGAPPPSSRTSPSNRPTRINKAASGTLHISNGSRSVTAPVNIPPSGSQKDKTPASSPTWVLELPPDVLRQLDGAVGGRLSGTISHLLSTSPPGSTSSSSSHTSMTQFDSARAGYEDIQRKADPNLTSEFLQNLVRGDLHVHFEGLLSAEDLFDIAKKMDQIRWNPEKNEFVSIQTDPLNAKYTRLNDLDQSTVTKICASMQARPGNNHYESAENFFSACDLREPLMNQIGLAALFPQVYEYLRGNRYVELMTVLNYKDVPESFAEIFGTCGYQNFLENVEVKKWIGDYVRESRSMLDACKNNLNAPPGLNNLSASQSLEKETIECFQVIQNGDDPLTIRFSIEVMRNQEPYQFFLKSAAACELIKNDYRVVSFTICGKQTDMAAKDMMTSQSKAIQILAQKYGDKFKFNPHFAEVSRSVRKEALQAEWNQLGAFATRRLGHATAAAPLETEIKAKGLAVEACLCSNHTTLGIDAAQHPLRFYLEKGIRAVFGSDDPGIIEQTLLDNMAVAVNVCKLNFEQFLDCIRASATFSHLDGESIYEPNTTRVKADFQGFVFNYSDDEFSDGDLVEKMPTSERAQLEVIFERKIQEFIHQVARKRNFA